MKKIYALLLLFVIFSITVVFSSCSNNSDSFNDTLAYQTESDSQLGIKETVGNITESTTVPDLIDVKGMTKETAISILESKGYIVEIKEENSDTVENGIVISQQPTPENNLKLKKGDTVTLIVSKGKAEDEKIYLDTMTYSEFTNPDSPKNNFSAYSGEDRHENQCVRAVKYYITGNSLDVSEEVYERGKTSYTVSYMLDGKYNCLSTELTGAPNSDNYMEVGINIYGDDKILYGITVTEETTPLPLNIDVNSVNKLTIEITSTTGSVTNGSQGAVILNNAYFE